MNPNDAEQFIIDRVSVTHQAVIVAKAYALKHLISDTGTLIDNFLREMEVLMPKQIVLHQSVDPISDLNRVVESLSWRLAMCEAVWGLIHANILVPVDFSPPHFSWTLAWTTVVPGSGGQSSGWDLSKLAITVPARTSRAPSWKSNAHQVLSDGDLYLREVAIPSLHPEIEEALRDAVTCFRYELYTPALAMLAKAAEGAWLELGTVLVTALPDAAKPSAERSAKELKDQWISIAKKTQIVVNLYSHSGLQPVKEKSGLDDNDLKQVLVWSDVVRESRNVVHYGVQSPTANTYEKVAALLLGAVPHFRLLYRIYDAAQAIIAENASGKDTAP